MNESASATLAAGAEALGIALDAQRSERLLRYLELLTTWNKVYNLTAVRDAAAMVTHHVLDCLAVLAPLARQVEAGPSRLLDVGSGGGLPGVVIAICQPDVQVDCVDAVGKKAAFVQQVAATLGLANLRGLHMRVQDVRQASYGVVAARAFASLADFTGWSADALAPGGVWMAMKGRPPLEEIAALPPEVDVFHVEPLRVPGLDAERCIVWMRPRAAAGD